jgi:hypothetical protein
MKIYHATDIHLGHPGTLFAPSYNIAPMQMTPLIYMRTAPAGREADVMGG